MEQTKGVLFEAIMLESRRMFEPVIRLEKIAGCLIGWNFGGMVTIIASCEAFHFEFLEVYDISRNKIWWIYNCKM